MELPDGTPLDLPPGATGAEAAAAIGPGLARAALAVKVDGELRDLERPLDGGRRLEVVTERSPEALHLIRHDCAHVLATAVLELYPGVKISIGPPIDAGFYYDFEFPEGVAVSDADLERIEARMREHVKAAEPFVREDVGVGDALERFVREGQDYKIELIEDLVRDEGVQTVSLYTNGPFTDLCRGPHGPSTRRIGAFKLESVAGAYWRGDSERTMLTRIYGTAFATKQELAEHLERLEQARARDHRRLGRELGLVQFSDVSPGAAFWLPAGTTLFNTLLAVTREFWREHGYDEVKTPQLYDAELWRTSGHWGNYREHMFVTESEGQEMALKPMNCPGHAHLYGSQRHSYRELPIRYAEPGLLHRNELSGALHGLLRARHFCQDDAHIFCTEEQVESEVARSLGMSFALYELFGFDVALELSTRPEKRVGDDALWDRAEAKLRRVLDGQGLSHVVNEGDGAFYGPKIDMHMTDSLGRSWQLGTVQLDYSMPAAFELAYTGADNAEHRPVMIHRAIMGSLERFVGILIEHYGGGFPLWLAPVQAIVLTIADRHAAYAAEVLSRLRAAGVRAELDDRSESVGRKIRDAELRKLPYMLVVGDREADSGQVGVREHRGGDAGAVALDVFIERVAADVRARGGAPAAN